MMRVPRKELDEAVESLLLACAKCTDTNGLRLAFHPTTEQAEAVILGAMTVLSYPTGPVSPDDVFFLTGIGTDLAMSWPPSVKNG